MEQKHFLLSYRFNKTTPAEFGLIGQDDRTYLCPKDNALWVQMDLYDFGWGREYGFCKIPMLDFEQLFDLLIHAQLEDNRYGAAAVLLDVYAGRLLDKCLDIIQNSFDMKVYKQAFAILKLDKPVNRSVVALGTLEEIQSDNRKWEYIARKVKEIG